MVIQFPNVALLVSSDPRWQIIISVMFANQLALFHDDDVSMVECVSPYCLIIVAVIFYFMSVLPL